MIALPVVRMAWGTALVLTPQAALHAVGDERHDAPTRRMAQLLGGRELAQAVVTVKGDRSQRVRLLSVAVDASHAVTMLALATRRPVYRRAAVTSALAAGCFAVAVAGARAAAETHPVPRNDIVTRYGTQFAQRTASRRRRRSHRFSRR